MRKENLIHVIASDAHDTVERPFNFLSSLKVLETDYCKAYNDYLVENARKIIESKDIEPFTHIQRN